MEKQQAINYFENATQLAAVCRVSLAAVSQWGQVIPERHALRLDRLTNGKLKYKESLYRKAA